MVNLSGPAPPLASASLHATVVALDDRGLLITGPSGSGKSSLALMLMAQGARLVADDRVLLSVAGGRLWARAPEALSGLIEARGVGLLRAEALPTAALAAAVRLGEDEPHRLPPPRVLTLHGIALPLVLGRSGPHLCAALRQMIVAGRAEPACGG